MAKVTLESLAGEIAELRARIETLEGRSALVALAPPAGEIGTTISYPQRVPLPSEAEARVQFANVIQRNPDALRLLYYARDGLGLSDFEREYFQGFRVSLARISELQKTDDIDMRRDVIGWCDNTEEWAANAGLGNHSLDAVAFVIAAMSRGCSVKFGSTLRSTYFNLSL